MLLVKDPLRGTELPPVERPELAGPSPVDMILGMMRRRWRLIAATFAVMLCLGVVYCLVATPRYTSTTVVLVDPRKIRLLQEQSILSEGTVDSPTMDSQLEIIRSDKIAAAVVRDLKLDKDPEFNNPPRGLLGSVLGFVFALIPSSGPPVTDVDPQRYIVDEFLKGLGVRRQGLTFALEIGFTSLDSAKAARIANAIAEKYIQDQLDSKYDASRRANVWLQGRMEQLGVQAIAADTAVQRYKSENNLFDTDRGALNKQQFGELSSQLISVRQQVGEAKARLDRINEVISKEGSLEGLTITDALKDEVVNKLRGQYADKAKRAADLAGRYGENHEAVVKMRAEMAEIQRSLRDELKRIAESYRSDYEIAKSREGAIQKNVDTVMQTSRTSNEAEVKLRQLESSAQTYRTLYDNFLQKYMETAQQESFPISDARVITPAAPSISPSRPRKPLILGGAGVLGLMLGFGLALLRERSDRVFRTMAQIEQALGLQVFGVLPLQVGEAGPTAATEEGALATSGLVAHVLDHPFSRYTETVRNVKVACDLTRVGHRAAVIGVTSCLPGEGKTSFAANLAQLIAHGGQRCVLVDADLRKPSMSRLMAPGAQAGLIEHLAGDRSRQQVSWNDPRSGLSFIPAVMGGRLPHTNQILSSQPMRDFIEELRDHADYIVVDMPPLVPVVDVRAGSHLVDAFVFVVEWGRTPQAAVADALTQAPVVRDKVLGCVMSKVDLKAMQMYEGHLEEYYKHAYHLDYGAPEAPETERKNGLRLAS